MASRKGRYGRASSASLHPPASTMHPSRRARLARALTRRVFPIPASPPTMTTPPSPRSDESSASSSADSSASRPTRTGDRTRERATLSEEVRQLLAQQLRTGRLRVGRHHRRHSLEREVGEGGGVLSGRRDRTPDNDSYPLAQPEIFGPRQRDGNHRNARLDREVSEALVKRHQLALGLSVVAFGEDRHRPAGFEAAVDVPVQGLVPMALAHDRHVAARFPDEPPLEPAGDQK